MSGFIKVKASKRSLSCRSLVYGVGVNDSWYSTSSKSKASSARCPVYVKWMQMIVRCYSDEYKSKNPSYKDCFVCDEWLVFSNFSKWFELNNVNGYELDKDIRVKGNKVYSPDTCLFVPACINTLFNGANGMGMTASLGFHLNKLSGRYIAQIRISGKEVHIGSFKNKILAHGAYAKAKNKEIKRKCKQYPELANYLINHLIEDGL